MKKRMLLRPDRLRQLLWRYADGEKPPRLAQAFGIKQNQVRNLIDYNRKEIRKMQWALRTYSPESITKPKIMRPEIIPGVWRNCLRCNREFWVDSKLIRICDRCKDTEDWKRGESDSQCVHHHKGGG